MTSAERTPTTDEIRSGYSHYTSGYWHEETEEGTAEFDRWLAVHDAEVRRVDASDAQVHAALSTYLDVHRDWSDWEKWQIESMREALRAALNAKDA